MLSDQAIFSLLQYAFLGRWRAQGEGKLEENIVDWEILSSPSPQAYHDLQRKSIGKMFYLCSTIIQKTLHALILHMKFTHEKSKLFIVLSRVVYVLSVYIHMSFMKGCQNGSCAFISLLFVRHWHIDFYRLNKH